MANQIKKVIFNKEMRDYFMSTHFWGPAFNWMIPISTISDIQRDPKYISGNMTLALSLYSMAFMRFSFKVKPRNLLLFACHVVNLSAQLTQGYRYLKYQRNLKLQNIQQETNVLV